MTDKVPESEVRRSLEFYERSVVVRRGCLKKNPSFEILVYSYREGVFKVYMPKEESMGKNPIVFLNNKVFFEVNAVPEIRGCSYYLNPKTNKLIKLKLLRKDLGKLKLVEYLFYKEFEKRINL